MFAFKLSVWLRLRYGDLSLKRANILMIVIYDGSPRRNLERDFSRPESFNNCEEYLEKIEMKCVVN